MAYRFKARSSTPGEYRFAATVLQNLIALSDIRSGTGRGDGGIGTYNPDFPDAGNVTQDDTVNGVAGTYVEVAEADVELGVQYGAGGTEKTGTLVVGAGADYPDAMTFGD